MAKLPPLPLWTDDFLSDCSHLSDTEMGLYLRILIQLWRAPKQRMPLEGAWLARKFGKTMIEVEREIMPLIREFCQSNLGKNFFTQKRLVREYKFVMEKREKQSARAKSRKIKESDDSHGNAALLSPPIPLPI